MIQKAKTSCNVHHIVLNPQAALQHTSYINSHPITLFLKQQSLSSLTIYYKHTKYITANKISAVAVALKSSLTAEIITTLPAAAIPN